MKRDAGLRLSVIGPLLVVTVAAGLVGGALLSHSMRSAHEAEVLRRANAIATAVNLAAEVASSPASLHRFVSALGAERNVEAIVVVGGDPPQVLASTRAAWIGLDLDDPELAAIAVDLRATLLQKVQTTRLSSSADRVHLGVPLLLSPRSGSEHSEGAVLVSLDSGVLRAQSEHLRSQALFALLGMLGAVALVVGIVLGRNVLSRIDAIRAVVARREGGDESAVVPDLGRDEIGGLGHAINHMIDALIHSRDRIRDQARELSLQKAEIEVARDEALAAARAKAVFLATMSHEIRTPMNGVIGMTHLLLEDQLEPKHREYIETIEQSGESLLVLINDVLDFSRIESGRLDLESVALDPLEVCRQAIQTVEGVARQRDLQFQLSAGAEVPANVLGDPTRLRQILLNLLGNAVKFSESGGRIEITVAMPVEGRLRFEVRDDGIGIAAERVSSLFDAFVQADVSTTRKYGGTGLGLAISRQLAELMGGTIEVQTAEGEGSCFRVELPLPSCHPDKPESDVPSKAASRRDFGLRVLVAEDNLVNQKVARRMIERFGCEVVVAANGREAIEQVHASRFDLVFMDCQMPEVDGFEATREIRSRPPEGPRLTIAALTANAFKEDREACLAAGMDYYLAKPLRKDELESLLARLCDSGVVTPSG